MAGIIMCEPCELYNILNQYSHVPRLAEINYLCLIDARERQHYNVSHIVTARHVKRDSDGTFLMPEAVEIDSMQYIVVYDSDTSSLQGQGGAVECAQTLAKASLYPIHIVKGGYQKFSALYPFLRTVKIMYTIMELETLQTYPVEIIAGLLYMGDHKQATNRNLREDLKISAMVNISQSSSLEFEKGKQTILNIPVADSVMSDLYSSFETLCVFIGSHLNMGSRVLICSSHGISRCSAVTIAFLMHHLKHTLQEAWEYVLKCKNNMRPNRGFVQQLSDWELHTMGKTLTDVSEPHF
ncbi:serine/threonine/tyrosine-interacting-like protein 1 [Centroberyx gerrardi]|uniref:serine/threonine/tyrosine-interacting-like protein 1 n=1 Tax=Centroberyx gerrardi TaxID=166262 RepID=UPI003AAA36AC